MTLKIIKVSRFSRYIKAGAWQKGFLDQNEHRPYFSKVI